MSRSVKHFGVRVVSIHWACANGGDDYTGTEAEMMALAEEFRSSPEQYPAVLYDVVPYQGEDGTAPPINRRGPTMDREVQADIVVLRSGRNFRVLKDVNDSFGKDSVGTIIDESRIAGRGAVLILNEDGRETGWSP